MVVILVVLSFVALVLLDYFVFSKHPVDEPRAVRGARASLSTAHQPIPPGIYLQPTYTWGRVGPAGEVYLGVHPMLLGLVGAPHEFELLNRGDRVAKGEPLVRVTRAGRQLTVRSPVAGRVELVQRPVTGTMEWSGAEANDGAWLYRVLPEGVAQELPAWLSGQAAADWTHRQYDRIRAYLQETATDARLGPVMADGGELAAGILGELDQGVWTGLESRFLVPTI